MRKKRGLQYSSLQNQWWSWRLEYCRFLICNVHHIIIKENKKSTIFKSPTPSLVLETWILEPSFLSHLAPDFFSFFFGGFGVLDISCRMLLEPSTNLSVLLLLFLLLSFHIELLIYKNLLDYTLSVFKTNQNYLQNSILLWKHKLLI